MARLARATDWLQRIEQLKPGDACEVLDTRTGQWVSGIVDHNGGTYFWRILVGNAHFAPFIEHVRCPGQTEAWPKTGVS